ncbi:MAG: sigma-70 family RNA polymerase sigma factor [Cyclobacteriaceae bacterium]
MDEKEVIERLRSGGEKELEMIYLKYRDEFLFWITKNFTCPLDEAKDIYQVSILTLYENVVQGKVRTLTSSIKTYLFAIGKNKALASNKKAQRFTSDFSDNMDVSAIENGHSSEDEERWRLVESSLDKLGDPCRTLLKQYYYHKKAVSDIAVELGYKNADTAKNLKYKCMKRLKKIFETELINFKEA